MTLRRFICKPVIGYYARFRYEYIWKRITKLVQSTHENVD